MTAVAGDPGWRARPMLPADIAQVIALAADEPTAPHWPPFEYQRMLEVIRFAPERRSAWVLCRATSGDSDLGLAGFAMAGQVAGVCDLEAVVVAARWRGRRLGAQLVGAVADWARACGVTQIQLEVRPSNTPAVQLYTRFGFRQDGLRTAYYRNPEEDALLMSLALR